MSSRIVLHIEPMSWRARLAQWIAPRGWLLSRVKQEPWPTSQEMNERIEKMREALRDG